MADRLINCPYRFIKLTYDHLPIAYL